MDTGTLAVLLIFGTLFIGIVGSLFIIVWVIWRSSQGRQDSPRQAEEARLVQELYQGLSRMEERVEVLETLVLDRQKKEGRQ